jgi:hypothetical protein
MAADLSRPADPPQFPLTRCRRQLPRPRGSRSVAARSGIQAGGARHRHQMVAPEVAALAFDTALLMPLAGRVELGGKPPVLHHTNDLRKQVGCRRRISFHGYSKPRSRGSFLDPALANSDENQ